MATIACGGITLAGANFSPGDCLALPEFAALIFSYGNYEWEKVDLSTEDDYELTMVHITDNAD